MRFCIIRLLPQRLLPGGNGFRPPAQFRQCHPEVVESLGMPRLKLQGLLQALDPRLPFPLPGQDDAKVDQPLDMIRSQPQKR